MKPIICRTDQRAWWIVFPFLLMALAFLIGPLLSQDSPEKRVMIIMGFMAGTVGLVAGFYMMADLARGEIRADETGLQWRRGFGRRRSARWEEISDFYLRVTSNATHFIETPAGKLGVNSKEFVGIDAILAIVPARAVNARASIWETRGFRPDENWSETLTLWTGEQKWMPMILTLFPLPLLALPFTTSRQSLFPTGHFWIDIFPLILGALCFGALALGYAWMIKDMWRDRKFAHRHRADTLRLDADGLIWSGANERVSASWDEVQRIETLPVSGSFTRTCVRVTTARGSFMLWRLGNSWMLNSFLKRCQSYAPNAVHADENTPSLDDELRAPRVNEENGEVFSFYTRNNRLVWLVAASVLLLAPLLYLANIYSAADDTNFAPSWPLFWSLCALCALVTGVLWLWIRRIFIVVNARELRVHWPTGRVRSVAWASIEATGADAWGHWIRADGRKTYWALGLFPARRAQLNALIENRGAR